MGIAEGKAVGQREGGVYAHMSMFALLGGGVGLPNKLLPQTFNYIIGYSIIFC